ncbi:MAG: hypothetical protein JRM77_02890 [Nitrososphaerota archaeon]|jgi:hypothetical protein|nr:hypothetical protein [Nitrososphaerota archaeon]
MGLKSGIRYVSVSYRNVSRMLFIILVVVALALSTFSYAFAQNNSAPTGTLTPKISVGITGYCYRFASVRGQPSGPSGQCSMQASGTLTLNSTNTPSGPITISGSITGVMNDGAGNPYTANLNFSKTIQWPAQKSVSISGTAPFAGAGTVFMNTGSFVYQYSFTATTSSGQVVASASYSDEKMNPTFQLVVMLPLFNVTSMDAIFHCNGAVNCAISSNFGNYYEFIMLIGIVITVVAALVSFSINQNSPGGNTGSTHSWIMEALMTIVLIIAFPWIYNEVAGLLNYVNATLISGPGTLLVGNVYTTASSNVQAVWNAATGNTAGINSATSLTSILGEGLLTIAAWFIALFVAIGVWVLGILRVFIIAVMIAAFPLSLALKNIHFTEKLAGMIEDTLYGVMIATIMSAIVLGLTSQLMANSDAQLSSSILAGSSTFVAAIALLTALMMPTIFAPLTSTLFQTGMQMAMAAGSMASMVSIGTTTGVFGAASSIGSNSPTNIAAMAAATNTDPGKLMGMSTLGRASHALSHGYGLGTMMAPLQNAGSAVGAGVMGAVGAGAGAKALQRYHKHGDQIAAGHEQYAQNVHAGAVMSRLNPMLDPVTTVTSGLAGGQSLNPVAAAGMYSGLGKGNYINVDQMATGAPTGSDLAKAQKLKDWSERSFTGAGFVNELVTRGAVSKAELDANPKLQAMLTERGDALHKSISGIDPTTSYENLRKVANVNNFVRYAIHKYNTGDRAGIKPESFLS